MLALILYNQQLTNGTMFMTVSKTGDGHLSNAMQSVPVPRKGN